MTNKDFFISTWKSEMQTTLTALKGLPENTETWSYRCNPKTRSTSEIIGHMLPHAEVISNAIDTGIADERTTPHKFSNLSDAIEFFEHHAEQVSDKLGALDEQKWDTEIIDFQVDGASYYKFPVSRLAWMLLFDIVHHRGQLSTYYRPMGVRNPSIYGPTAEDVEAMMAAAKN